MLPLHRFESHVCPKLGIFSKKKCLFTSFEFIFVRLFKTFKNFAIHFGKSKLAAVKGHCDIFCPPNITLLA